MLYITGDTHGDRARWSDPGYGIEGRLKAGDMLIICGDFKYIFDDENIDSEEAFLDELAGKPFEILFCDGNHENFPRLSVCPEEERNGGRVHRIRHNILHLMRGQVYGIEGARFFVMGGGCSFGNNPPLIPGRTWWPQETPSCEEYREAKDNLGKCGYQVDYIVTHTAPWETMRVVAPDYEADALNFFLDWVQEKVTYRHWYMGHLHLDIDLWRKQTILQYEVRRLDQAFEGPSFML